VSDNSSQIERLSGFLQAVREAGVSEDNIRIIPGAQVEDALARNNIGQLLYPIDYTAIVSFRDEVSYPVMHVLQEHGISIPKEVSVISFDNLRAENPSRPALTSIYTEQSIAEIGVKLLLERIADQSLPPRSVILPVRIFDGGTTAPPCR
jgi:LacI family transcriptional regulator